MCGRKVRGHFLEAYDVICSSCILRLVSHARLNICHIAKGPGLHVHTHIAFRIRRSSEFGPVLVSEQCKLPLQVNTREYHFDSTFKVDLCRSSRLIHLSLLYDTSPVAVIVVARTESSTSDISALSTCRCGSPASTTVGLHCPLKGTSMFQNILRERLCVKTSQSLLLLHYSVALLML